MTPNEKYEYCENAFAEGYVDINHKELGLPAPQESAYDDYGKYTEVGNATTKILDKLRKRLAAFWEVMPVNEAYFNRSEEPRSMEEAEQFIARSGSPMCGLRQYNGRPDWLFRAYAEKRGVDGGGQFRAALDVVGAAVQRRNLPMALGRDAVATTMRAGIGVQPGTKKLIKQTQTTFKRLV